VSPGPLALVVTFLVGYELAVDDIGDASFQGSERFLFGFAFRLFLVVVDLADTGRFADLGHGSHMNGMVEDPVATHTETMFLTPT
jgi:hypothetical protein